MTDDKGTLNTNEVSDVERLKKQRANFRRLFTTACNQFVELTTGNETESKQIHILYNKILDKSNRLFDTDTELCAYLESSDEEFDLIESYRDRFTEIKTLYELYVNSIKNDDNISVSSTSSSVTLNLPKLNFKEFDLMPRTWVAFWGQFSRIHEDDRLKEEDKFQYLLSSLKPKTKARDIANSYPPSKENYGKAIDHLKSRFGRDDLLIEVYIRDLLTLVTNRANVKLSALYDQLSTYLRALETLGVTTENYASMLYPVVESCLPMDILKAWDRHRLNRESDSDSSRFLIKEKLLEELMTFLRNEVEGEERRALAESGFVPHTKIKRQNQDAQPVDVPSASALVSSSGNVSSKLHCLFCDKGHNSQDCGKTIHMSLEEKRAAVMKKKCCLVCLKVGHMAKTCHSSVRCIVCARRHYALLCPELSTKEHSKKDENTSSLFSTESSPRIIYLKTLMVCVRNKGRLQYVRALLDDGSHRSYIEEDLAKELRLSPSGKEVLSQGLFGGGQTPEAAHGRYDVNLESLNGKFSCQVSVLDQPIICTTLPRVKDPELMSELADHGINLTDIGPEEPPIRILLGADILGKILTGKIQILRSGISAIETRFGWSVLGTQKRRATINMISFSLQNFEIPKLWELETLGITDPLEKKSSHLLDEETLAHFQETVRVNPDQRYEVTLPWLAGHPPLSNHYDLAESRLRSISKRQYLLCYFKSVLSFNIFQGSGNIREISGKSSTKKLGIYINPFRKHS